MSAQRSFFDILFLCLKSRCPVCAKGHLFRPLLNVRSLHDLFLPQIQCESCRFRFRREEGYYFGVLTPILPILSVALGALIAGLEYEFVSNDLNNVFFAGAAGAFLGLFLFFRSSIAIYVSLDHAIDPPTKAV